MRGGMMATLQLGPVIGTIGGKAKAPIEYGGSGMYTDKTVVLPEGKWAVAITVGRATIANSPSTLRVNGSLVLGIVGNVQNSGSPTSLLRQQSGTLTMASVGIAIVSVTAFPEAD